MPRLSRQNPGAYRAGNSLVHRFDPRCKLLLLLGVIACLFSAVGPLRPLLIAGVWLAGAWCCRGAIGDSWRVTKLVRWLLLFTLLLHLCFTPGRTLFGVSWLSYDGLLRGLLVDSQLLLAILFSLLLSWTTRPAELAWGLARLLAPLQKLKVPVAEAGGLLLLVLHFFPLIQEELEQLKAQQPAPARNFSARLQDLVGLVQALLLRLVDRADQLATDILNGNVELLGEDSPVDGRISRPDLLLFFVGVAVLVLLWMV